MTPDDIFKTVVSVTIAVLGYFLHRRDREIDKLTQTAQAQSIAIASMQAEIEMQKEAIDKMGTHVNKWLVDIPQFYRDFPNQIKRELKEEMQPRFDSLEKQLESLDKKLEILTRG